MASRQQLKEERAEAAARTAADELGDINRERRECLGVDDVDTITKTGDRNSSTNAGPGIPIIGGILKSVQGTLEHAKDAVTGGKAHDQPTTEETAQFAAERKDAASNKAWEAAERAGEYKGYTDQKSQEVKDSAVQKAGEYKDYTAQKAGETKDAAVQKAREASDKVGEYKDYTSEKAREAADAADEKSRQATSKAGEYKDYTSEKAKETKDSTMNKIGEYKDSAMEKTKETKDSAMDKAKETKDAAAGKMGEYKDYAVDKAKETKDSVAEKAKETADATSQKAGEYKDYAVDKATDAKDTTMEKAKEGKDATGGKLSDLKDSAAGAARRAMDYLTGKKDETSQEIKDKYNQTTEHEARQKMQGLNLREQGGAEKDVETYKVKVEKTPAGDAASFLKNADELSSSGQTFNDPAGRIEEGTDSFVTVESMAKAAAAAERRRNEK